MGKQRVALKYDAEIALVDRNRCHIIPIQGEGSFPRLDKACHYPQSGGFSAAAGAKEGHQLALFYRQIQSLQDLFLFIIADADFL